MERQEQPAPSRLDPAFFALAAEWMQAQAAILLGFVWSAYDGMRSQMPTVDGRDLERSITQLLEPRIRQAMTGDEPFYVQHGPFERETMAPPPAQPPAYDLAFVLQADERVMWPLEAKILETPSQLADYVRDVRDDFLTCRYAPFSSAGGMLGYLLTGKPVDAFVGIASRLGSTLETVSAFPNRPHRVSSHQRTIPPGKAYPSAFNCHHMILEYHDLARTKATRR